ncbi:hypothetical protein ElyMa_003466900 [Elysia marginata]|uniref:Uncharacterized protein n=1 Tax=Elysia marginata TaxID=1093978 RepID=A0AAV4EAZ8_9GAST|nr:hypothetical protein ElyMa_003466900 [Elysia marginata]
MAAMGMKYAQFEITALSRDAWKALVGGGVKGVGEESVSSFTAAMPSSRLSRKLERRCHASSATDQRPSEKDAFEHGSS